MGCACGLMPRINYVFLIHMRGHAWNTTWCRYHPHTYDTYVFVTRVTSFCSTNRKKIVCLQWYFGRGYHWNLGQGYTVPCEYFTGRTRVSLSLYYLYGWEIIWHWQCRARRCIASLLLVFSRSVTVIKISSLSYKGLKLSGTDQPLTMLCIIVNINNYHLTYGIVIYNFIYIIGP